jgi:hypothetical protein
VSVSPGERNCSQYREAAGLFESYCIDGARINLTDRFPLIVAALAKLRSGAMTPMCSSMPST